VLSRPPKFEVRKAVLLPKVIFPIRVTLYSI
jgi:hypothetical protein